MIGGVWFKKDDVNAFLRSFRLRNHTSCEAAHLPQFFDGSGLQDDKTTGQRDRADGAGVKSQRTEVRDGAKVRNRSEPDWRYTRGACAPQMGRDLKLDCLKRSSLYKVF